jgi:hypothetical protein
MISFIVVIISVGLYVSIVLYKKARMISFHPYLKKFYFILFTYFFICFFYRFIHFFITLQDKLCDTIIPKYCAIYV